MKNWLSAFITATLSMVLFSSISFAAGFRLPEQGAAAMGMSSAFVGQADDPSAVWYNPAAITQLDGTRISAGFVAVAPIITHENLDGTTDVSKRAIHLPANFYVTNKMNDKVSIGLGINNPFGLSTDWPATSETTNVATFSHVVSTEINPNIAYKINSKLSVAAGIAYMKLRATLEKYLAPFATFRLNGDGEGWGANAAMFYRASDRLNVGFSYRSRIKVKITDGTADFAAAGLSFPASTDLTLPDLMQLGVSYKASDKLTLNGDLDYTMWSTYDRTVVSSTTVLLLTGSPTSTDEHQWKDVWALRIGGQYKLSDQWKLRAGYIYDKNPVPNDRIETRLPDSDRHGLSVGAGYTVGKVTIDGAFQHLFFMNRKVSNSLAGDPVPNPELNGTYRSHVDSFAFMVSYKF